LGYPVVFTYVLLETYMKRGRSAAAAEFNQSAVFKSIYRRSAWRRTPYIVCAVCVSAVAGARAAGGLREYAASQWCVAAIGGRAGCSSEWRHSC